LAVKRCTKWKEKTHSAAPPPFPIFVRKNFEFFFNSKVGVNGFKNMTLFCLIEQNRQFSKNLNPSSISLTTLKKDFLEQGLV
jgi:hypothetical protein